ncbi:MAG TPA: azurin [Flavobacteriaceae bacterium]|nr:azurin [Flavobacteriaceae bacterium]
MKKLLVIFVAALALSCGDNKKKDETTTRPIGTDRVEDTTPVATDDAVANLSIEGNDQMQFNKKELRVKAGQKVRLTLKHVGKMEKNVMGHNWVLLTQGTDIMEFGQAANTAEESDYIPKDRENQVIAHTRMLGGGESDTIEFDAPAPGTYDFICSFPGHVALMKGKFIVE